VHISNPEGPFDPTWESLERYQIPEWYLDAKFGIFIHWGVYSVPAFRNEWYPRNMYRRDFDEFNHHVKAHGPQSKFGYKDFIPGLTASKFDAGAWADLFHRAGARYVVPVAEHHDGFQMYDSALSDWNAVKMGPKRDVVGELAAAVRGKGMTFGVSSHRAEHWWFFDGGMEFDSDVRDPANAGLYGPAQREKASTPDEKFLDDWLARCCELIDKYRPQLFWFDWWIEQPVFAPYLRRFAAYYYNRAAQWGQGVALNYKNEAFPIKAAVWDIERGQLADVRNPYWQTDTSISKNSWGYVAEQDYKTPAAVLHDLIDIVSKNGCLLLNIGPRPDGTIPEPEADTLLEIGAWLAKSGESIYGTRPWKVYGEGPTPIVGGAFNDTRRQAFTSRDIRFTTKGNALYAILLGPPEGSSVEIRSLGSALTLLNREIAEVRLVETGEALIWQREPGFLRVALPSGIASPAVALKIATR
jgi:alpha-L-fucosidase